MNKAEKKRTPRKLLGFLMNFSKKLEKASNSAGLLPEKLWKWVKKTFPEPVRFFRKNIKESLVWLHGKKRDLDWEVFWRLPDFLKKAAKWNEFFETRLLPVAIVLCAGFLSCIMLIPNFWENLRKAWQLCVHYQYLHHAVVWILFPLLVLVIRHWMSEKKETSDLDSNLPTEGREQIIASFLEDNPVIDRTADVHGFIQKITLLDPNKRNVVALDGKWGCGKSTFVSHVILLRTFMFEEEARKWDAQDEDWQKLRKRCDAICGEQYKEGGAINSSLADEYLYYDAWQNDAFDGEPILSILYNLFPEELKTPVMKQFKNCRYEIVNFIVTSIEAIVNSISLPPDVRALVRAFMVVCKLCRNGIMIKDNNDNVRGEFIEAERYKRLHTEIENLIGLLIKKRSTEKLEKKRFIIFIDELDRCNPLFAVRVLERVKHFFDNEKLVFVFSVNLEQLQHTIKKVYGHDFDAIHYLHRFFTERAELPAVDTKLFIRNEYLGAKKKQEKTEEQNNG